MSGRDITEGRGNYSIAVDIGIKTGNIWQNSGYDYDCAIAGLPFLMAQTDQHAYERGTTPFRKNQFDTQRDPGEQSLQGWWLRSQSSFHAGQGIKFYDPFANPFSTTLASNSYRYSSSFGVDTFTFGQVNLLNRCAMATSTTAATHLESYNDNTGDYVLMLDTNIYKVDTTGTKTTVATAVNPIYSFTTDGTNLYYLDSGHFIKVPVAGGTAVNMYNAPASVTSSVMHWVKQRLVAGANNSLYEVTGTGTSLAPIYTHPNANWQWTDIDEAGPAIYAAGYAGAKSTIFMFTLTTAGTMPTLTSGIVAAQLPDGEVVYSMYSHLGAFLIIGTNKGVRVAQVDQATGYLTYGPLLVNTNKPVRGFAARDSYVWFGSSVTDGTSNNWSGTWKIDLSNEISTLTYAVQQDIYAENTLGGTIDVAFYGTTNRLSFLSSFDGNASASQGLWLQSATEVLPTGFIQTGYIRYNTMEQKNFKRIVGRGDFGISPSSNYPGGKSKGSMTISAVDMKSNVYNVVSYDNVIGTPESTITQPVGAQDAIALRFDLYRDAVDITASPIFTGYQLKAVPSTPRTRMIKIPLLNFDTEEDKYNAVVGYEGRAWDRLGALETIEAAGDVITFQDFRTNETVQCLIEDVQFRNTTPPDKRLTGFGGILMVTIRTV